MRRFWVWNIDAFVAIAQSLSSIIKRLWSHTFLLLQKWIHPQRTAEIEFIHHLKRNQHVWNEIFLDIFISEIGVLVIFDLQIFMLSVKRIENMFLTDRKIRAKPLEFNNDVTATHLQCSCDKNLFWVVKTYFEWWISWLPTAKVAWQPKKNSILSVIFFDLPLCRHYQIQHLTKLAHRRTILQKTIKYV